jgi:hypothetical protein
MYCKLLCSSKAVAASLIELSSGQCQLLFEVSDSSKVKQLGAWLAKYAVLLAELHLLPVGRYSMDSLALMAEADKVTEAALGCAARGLAAAVIASQAAAPALGEGIMQAAQGTAGLVPAGHLLLRSLRHVGYGASHGAVLRHLPPHSMTEVELHGQGLPLATGPFGSESLLGRGLEEVLGPLRCLTNLQRLTLGVRDVYTEEQKLHLSGWVIRMLG